MERLIVLVTGVPAAGKSSLAERLADRLGLPVISKDDIKEALFDALGTGDRAWSSELSRASYEVVLAVARSVGAAVIDCNFRAEYAERLGQLPADVCEIHCRVPAEEIERRLVARAGTRHPGHLDAQLLAEWRSSPTVDAPLLHGGRCLVVDATEPFDVDAIERWVRTFS